jgi:hypothetical protein
MFAAVQAQAQTPVTKVAVGQSHTCAVTTAGGLKCWGSNSSGQLGDGTSTSRLTPIDVPGLTSGVVDVGAGEGYTCALTSAGGVKCWGSNFGGQLGNGRMGNDLISVPTPGDVVGLTSGVRAIAVGFSMACALTTDGALNCWGSGYLGNGGSGASAVPVDVTGLGSGVAAVNTDGSNSCALMVTGGVKCWGYSSTRGPYLAPVDVPGLPNGVTAISGRAVASTLPTQQSGGCALTSAGGVTCWTNDFGAFPTPEGLSSGIAKLSSPTTRCVVTTGGGAKCWGFNGQGELGDGTTTLRLAPVDVSGLASGVASISANAYGTCAVTTAGDLWCWGWNVSGGVGDGTTTPRHVPTRVVGLNASAGSVVPYRWSGLWWQPNESGWGLHFSHRGNILFAAWYTYDGVGNPKWYVMPRCELTGLACSASLYEVNGPRFPMAAFDPSAVWTSVAGTVNVNFQDADNASFRYALDIGQGRTVAIKRQVFGSGTAPPPVDYTDLWWNPTESGWGLGVTHRFDNMFLAWFAYDGGGRPVWYVASNCIVNAMQNGCSGTLYRTTGPPFGPSFISSQVQAFAVGTASLSFHDPNNGTLSYVVDGVSSSRPITRQLF